MIIWRNLWCLSAGKNQLHLSCFSWDIGKILQTCYFGNFGHAWLPTLKVIPSNCRKLLCLSAGKKSTSHPTIFWRYCKDMQISNFGYLGHVWPCTPKLTVWTCKKRGCLFACCMTKINFIVHFFLEILHFNESFNLIGQQHFGP